MRPNVVKAILGGLVATIVLTLIMYYVAPIMTGQPMDVAQMLAGMMGMSWMMGMIVHFILGTIVFPLIYVYVLYGILPGPPWMKGMIWGLILWLIAEIAVMPMAGADIFHSEHPAGFMAAIGSLMGHLVYGAILGAIAGGPEA